MNNFEQKYSGTPEKPNSLHLLAPNLFCLHKMNYQTLCLPSIFFKPDQNVVFLKLPRYIKFSEHKHSFIEMNYVLSGTCKQMINGKEVMLKEGDLCLLDTNVTHAIDQAGENDIVINIMIRTSYFDSALLRRLSGNDLLTDFFVNTIYKHKEDSRYIIFSKHSTSRLRELILQALLEYSHPQLCSKEAINSYML